MSHNCRYMFVFTVNDVREEYNCSNLIKELQLYQDN